MSLSNADIASRFDELISSYASLTKFRRGTSPVRYDNTDWSGWAISCLNIVRIAFGEQSDHYSALKRRSLASIGRESEVNAIFSILLSAKSDFDRGLNVNLTQLVTAEVLGDLINMSKISLSEGHIEVSSVLACAALEDAIKRYCIAKSIDTNEKSLKDLVNAMKANGLVSGAQKSLLDTMPKVRDYAMHANWSKISAADVGSVIGFVEQFLLSNFPNP